jgi:hypothetical protein
MVFGGDFEIYSELRSRLSLAAYRAIRREDWPSNSRTGS